MSDRPTPESDSAWEASWSEGGCDEDFLLVTMQRLERQRNEARELARELRDVLEVALEHAEPGVWIPHKSGDPNLERLLSCVLADALTKTKEVLP
jgi:hypothetical protein